MTESETRLGFLVLSLTACLIVVVGAVGLGMAEEDTASVVSYDPNAPGGDESQRAVSGNVTPSVAINATGTAIAEEENGTVYLLQEEPFQLVVSLTPGAPSREYHVCLGFERNDTVESTRCDSVSEPVSDSRSSPSTTFAFEGSPTNQTGEHTLVITLNGSTASTSDSGAGSVTTVHVIDPSGDIDEDQLSNKEELSRGTNLTDTDTDRDGLVDGAEVNEYGTDPRSADTDADGLRDGAEIQRGTDPTDRDSDNDGVVDGVEVEEGLDPMNADTDGDGLQDGYERDQGTDPLERDSDGDGLDDGREVAIGTDPQRVDTDGDQLGDALEWRLGTGPTNPWSPLAPIGILVIALLVVGTLRLGRSSPGIVEPLLARFRRLRRAEPGAGTPDQPEPTGGQDRPAEPSYELPPMTDEERVLDLLNREGGREKQVQVVEKTGWSKAKVSRVLSRMEEEGEITRIKIGRENLVCLEDHVPKGVQSPFED